MITEVNEFEDSLTACLEVLAGRIQASDEHFRKARYKLYDLATRRLDRKTYEALLGRDELVAMAAKASEKCCHDGKVEEREIARRMLTKSNLNYQDVYQEYHGSTYSRLANNEQDMLVRYGKPFLKGEHVAFVGAGAMPVSAMILAHEYGLFVDCIESDKQCAEHGLTIVQKLALQDSMRVLNCWAHEVDFGIYSKVICANWISCFEEMITAIQRTSEGQLVLFRDARPLTCSFCINRKIDLDLCLNLNLEPIDETKADDGLSLISRVYLHRRKVL